MRGKIELLRFAACAALLLLGAGLASCDRGPEKPAGASAAAASPRRGGTVVMGWLAEPSSANYLIVPSSQVTNEVLFRVFLHLVEEQADFADHPPTMAPMLAKSWEWSPDHKTITFHLRENVVWSDGVPVTAADVRWTWQAQINPDVAWEYADAKGRITDVEIVDPHTVRYHFSQVYATQLLDINEGMVLPKHAWEKLSFSQWRQNGEWFKQHLVVNGPFTIASWVPGQQIVLQRNPRYYEKGLPYLDRAVMRPVADQATAFAQLLNGELDFVPQLGPPDVPRVKANPRLQLIPYWFNLYVFVGWNNDRPLFKDPEVRRALTLAIDRQTIVETLLGPYGRVASSPILSSVWAHPRSLQPWPYDPAEARKILAAKGWRDTDGDGVLDRGGKPFAFELLVNSGNQLRTDAAVMIQDHLKRVGIRCTPRQVEFNWLVEQSRAGTFDAIILGQSMDTSLDLRSTFHSAAIQEGSNAYHYRNPEVDRLIDEAAAQRDILAEKPYLERIQQILHQEQPFTFLWESQRLTAADKRVHNLKPTMLWTLFNLKEWWVEPKD